MLFWLWNILYMTERAHHTALDQPWLWHERIESMYFPHRRTLTFLALQAAHALLGQPERIAEEVCHKLWLKSGIVNRHS
jgi:hypothetical protein